MIAVQFTYNPAMAHSLYGFLALFLIILIIPVMRWAFVKKETVKKSIKIPVFKPSLSDSFLGRLNNILDNYHLHSPLCNATNFRKVFEHQWGNDSAEWPAHIKNLCCPENHSGQTCNCVL